MVKSCVYEILALPFYIDTIYKKTHRQTPLGIAHDETIIFQCCFLIQYRINHKNISIMCAYNANCMQNFNNPL